MVDQDTILGEQTVQLGVLIKTDLFGYNQSGEKDQHKHG